MPDAGSSLVRNAINSLMIKLTSVRVFFQRSGKNVSIACKAGALVCRSATFRYDFFEIYSNDGR